MEWLCIECNILDQQKTPQEHPIFYTLWKIVQTPVDISHLKVIGWNFLCCITTSKVNRSKFDPRDDPCVLTGYPHHQKAYKVLNLSTNKTIVSRDVIFYGKHFPLTSLLPPSTDYSTQFFLPIITPFSSEEHSFSNPTFDPSHTEID